MVREWLIRTARNQILGPISKTKLIELLEKGSLHSEDEVCSGNGFWFKIKEDEMVQDYIRGSYKQEFNQISEAKNITDLDGVLKKLAEAGKADLSRLKEATKIHLPSDEDLAYPDVAESKIMEPEDQELPDITRVGGMSLEVKPVSAGASIPSVNERKIDEVIAKEGAKPNEEVVILDELPTPELVLSEPQSVMANTERKIEKLEIAPRRIRSSQPKRVAEQTQKKKSADHRWLYIMVAAVIIMLALVIKKRSEAVRFSVTEDFSSDQVLESKQ